MNTTATTCTASGCENPAVATFATPVGQRAACIPHFCETRTELGMLFPGTRPAFILSPAQVIAATG